MYPEIKIVVDGNIKDLVFGYNDQGIWIIMNGVPYLIRGELYDELEEKKEPCVITPKHTNLLSSVDLFNGRPTAEEHKTIKWERRNIGIKLATFVPDEYPDDIKLYKPNKRRNKNA